MKCKYITIEREYGSGGTKIAKMLSEQTGVPCYGREILEEVSKKLNVPVEQIDRYEETATGSFLYSLYMMSQTVSGNADMLPESGHIYVEEQAVIQELARNKKAIFLGHCASEALKERAGVVKVFIHCSNEEMKKQRIIEDYGIEESQIDATKKRFDKKRSGYYSANTGEKWDYLKQYDLVLDSGTLGMDGCVAILKSLLDEK